MQAWKRATELREAARKGAGRGEVNEGGLEKAGARSRVRVRAHLWGWDGHAEDFENH